MQLSHLGSENAPNGDNCDFFQETGFLGNLARDNFVGNFMGYKFSSMNFSQKPRFFGENLSFPLDLQQEKIFISVFRKSQLSSPQSPSNLIDFCETHQQTRQNLKKTVTQNRQKRSKSVKSTNYKNRAFLTNVFFCFVCVVCSF